MARRLTGGKLVIASHNAGKIREIGDLVAPFGIAVVPAAALGLPEPPETEETFAGNARIKAHAAAQGSGLPALSDDSGICVDALDGAPGVHTADWAETGQGRDFRIAMRRLWDRLEQAAAPEPRRAQFACTLCLAWPDGHDEIFAGTVSGRLVWPMRGIRGFGFDPMFLPDGETETFGEMDPGRKHAISHRARAFDLLVRGCLDG
jgi:XTP/dITP diphosphohydrolase